MTDNFTVTLAFTFKVAAKDDVSAILQARQYLDEGARDNEEASVRRLFHIDADPMPIRREPIQ